MDNREQAIKDANSAARKARVERDYYKSIASIYQLAYDDETHVLRAISIMQGIWVELMSELLTFKKANGNTERVQKSYSRLMLLNDQLDIISVIQSDNYTLKVSLRDKEKKIHLQWTEINDLKKQLQLHTENL